jgi:8-oxo-dGTP diphosphatase
MNEKKHLNVVAAVVTDNDKYLCMQRTRSKLSYITEHWEFPGGKIEDGEDPKQTLEREIKEEMDWSIEVGRCLGTVEHEYPDFSITLTAYLCKPGNGDFKLLAHLDSRWLSKEELATLNWTEADRKLLSLL